MKNILSYKQGTTFTGQEILDWAYFQIHNKTSHEKQGKRIIRMYENTLKPDRNYHILSSYESFGCDDWIHKPLVIKEI